MGLTLSSVGLVFRNVTTASSESPSPQISYKNKVTQIEVNGISLRGEADSQKQV